MKIIHYSFYVSIDKLMISRRKTGYGYMVVDIAKSNLIEKDNEVSLLSLTSFTKNRIIDNVNYVNNCFFNVAKSLRFVDIVNCFKTFIGLRNVSNKEKLKQCLSMLTVGLALKEFKKRDVIHIHGIGPNNIYLIEQCIKNKINIIVTLHGLNSFDKSIKISNHARIIEKKFLEIAANSSHVNVVGISEGVIDTINEFLENQSNTNFCVIKNGARVDTGVNHFSLREKYEISEKSVIALCVGNFCKRKNQIGVVDAYLKLNTNQQELLTIIFLGNPSGDPDVQEKIIDNGLQDNLIVCGAIDKSLMSTYYSQSDFTVLASLNEGFGLSIVEGFFFGLPNLTYSNLDVVSEIFDEKIMVSLNDRSPDVLASEMITMKNRGWDSDYIKEYSKSFSLEGMGIKYLNLYKQVKLKENEIKY